LIARITNSTAGGRTLPLAPPARPEAGSGHGL
jgi:hypothetical protein